MLDLELAQSQLVELGLGSMAELLEAKVSSATTKDLSYLAFLSELLGVEIESKRKRTYEIRLQTAGLPFRKSFSDFDFNFCPSIDKAFISELRSLAFVSSATNLVLLGPPGVGKTHISVALGLEAITGGFSCYFTTLSKIANDLSSSYSPIKMRKYTSPKVLIIDEMGYRPLDRMAANYFFDIISARYETGTVILSSNKGFSEWGDLFSDPVLATAILDRLLHHCHVINIKGNSYRLKDRIKQGLYTNAEVADNIKKGEEVGK